MNVENYHYQVWKRPLLLLGSNAKSTQPLAHMEGAKADSGKVFAISYDLVATETECFLQPHCRAFTMVNDNPVSLKAASTPWVVQDFGTRFFEFLADTALTRTAASFLRKMHPSSDQDTYTFALCADGAAVISDTPSITKEMAGAGAVAGLILPDNVSNHQRLSIETNLVACAGEILRHNEKIIAPKDDPDFSVALTPL